jgi:PAS domain S-box-containing protein
VTQLLPGEPLSGRTIAAVVDGVVIDSFDYLLKGTPCENLLGSETSVISSHLTEKFPDAPILATLGSQAYVGRRLDNSSGEALGHLFVVFREPLKDVEFISSTLQIFAARAAAELERQETDAQVREQAALLEVAHEAIQVKDLDGSITYWNKGAERTFGWTAAEAVGRKAVDLLYKDSTVFQNAQLELLAKGEWKGEVIKRTKDGRELTMAARWTLVVDAQGRPKAVLAIDADITGEKKLETQLMVSDRMASVGTLAAGIAHEINNPLAAVMGNLDYIADSLGRLATGGIVDTAPGVRDAWIQEEIKSPLDDAREAAQRVRAIVRDLKIFSRSPNDEARGPVNVEAIMESSLRMAWNEIRHRAKLVKLYGRVPVVEANEGRLGQVFLNLVVNAAQSLPPGNAEQNEIRVTTRLDGERVIIEVSDTGAGIPPEIIGRIFDAFFTTKAVGVGTGLGLAICQRIVTDLGGALTVESEVGKGTTFRVSLPVCRKTESETVLPPEPVPTAGRRGRILVVDDEEVVVRTVKRILSVEHDVVATVSAAEALALCAAGEKFDLILCDLMMPDMTGMDLHDELSRIAPEQADSMIFITGGAFTEKARRFLSEALKEHIEKPFHAANLRAVVQRYLR